MYLNFICRVDRLTTNVSGERSYSLAIEKFDCISSWDDEQDWIRQISKSSQHAQIISFHKSEESIANHRDDIEELKSQGLLDPSNGGVKLWLPEGPNGNLFVTLMCGENGLGDVSTLADMALQNEHLFFQFSIDVEFSRFAENPSLARPVTFEMFCAGTRFYLPNLPEVQLVRRTIA